MAGNSHPLAERLHRALGPCVAGQVAGRMFAIPDPEGWYPAVVPGEGAAWGMVHSADAVDVALWAALDVYEQVVSSGAGYRRAEVAVVGQGPAQAYIWQGALPEGALVLEEGDFTAFLAKNGQRAFGG